MKISTSIMVIVSLFCFIFSNYSFAQNKNNDIAELRKSYGALYSKYQREGKTDSVLYIAKKLYPIAQRSDNDSLLVKSYNLLGNAYIMSSDFPSSLEYYLKSLELAQKIENIGATSIAYENASFSFFLIGNYVKGAEYGKQAVEMFKSHPELKKSDSHYNIGLANALDNWSLNLKGLKQYDKALELTLEGISLLDQDDYKTGLFFRSGLYGDVGHLYEKLGDAKKAEDYYLKSIALNEQWKILQVEAVTNLYYANFLYDRNRFPEAITVAKKGLQASIASKEKMKAAENADVLRKIYDKENKIDSAYFYAKLNRAYNDSIFSSQQLMTLQNITFKRENQERELEIEKEKLAEERKENLQYAAIGVGILAFLILYLIFSRSARVGKTTIQFLGVLSMLLVFEFLNLLLHPIIGKITHHSPFLMLVCMACIAAILIPMHHKLEHWLVHKLIEKNQNLRSKK